MWEKYIETLPQLKAGAHEQGAGSLCAMSWKEELLSEKNLSEVFRKGRALTGADYDKWIVSAVGLLLALLLVLNWMFLGGQDNAALLQAIVEWAGLGASFSTSILGFLLAGFAIFATLTKTEIFEILAQMNYPNAEISWLKFVFFNFMIVFVHYLAFLALCLGTQLLFSDDFPLRELLRTLLADLQALKYVFGGVGIVLIGSWFAGILLMLKSFIWNLYQSVLFIIVSDSHIRDRDKHSS